MKLGFLVLILVSLLFSCTTSECKWKMPVIKTTSFNEIMQLDVDSMLEATPVVLAINVIDSIDISEDVHYQEEDMYYDYSYPEQIYTTDSIRIFVDVQRDDFHVTSYNPLTSTPAMPVKIVDSIFHDEYGGYYSYMLDSVGLVKRGHNYRIWYDEIYNRHFEAFPLYIYNYSKTIQKIDKPPSHELSFILEAMNRDGQWKPIEFWKRDSFVCGFANSGEYLLKPDHFMVSYVKKYNGDFPTRLRVKLKSFNQLFYSNEFLGNINEGQFNDESVLANLGQRYHHPENKDLLEWSIQYTFLNDTYPEEQK